MIDEYNITILLVIGLISFLLIALKLKHYAIVPLHKSEFRDNKNAIQSQTLREQIEHFQSIFNSAPACFKLQNRDGTLARINQSGVDLLEASQTSELVGKSLYALIVPEYRSAYREMSNNVFLGNHGYLEFELITLKGHRRWMRTNAEPLRNIDQKVTHLIAITHDITENRLISQQLEAHRNKLQTIIESEPECVKLQDANGLIMEMNPAGLSLLEASSSKDVIGRLMYDFITPEYADEYRELTRQVFAGERASMEFEVFSINGRRHWMKTHAAPLFDHNDRVIALLAITRNIDLRKKNEARLYQQQIELARVCRLSTMGEMATSLAHELNQPLCAVSSYAESAKQLNLTENRALDDLLDKIVQQSWRATKIVQNMRTFVKKQAPMPEAISAESIVNSSMEFLSPCWRRKKIQISINISANLNPLYVDRIQIEQVLLNLLSNAIQAVDELPEQLRKIHIEVSQENREEVLFSVFNMGPGVPEDMAEDLFTPFFTTKDTGLGMGLSISRSIIEAHAGNIWYCYKANYGPCFCFTLPVLDDE